jgi:hypothetical protein
MNQQNSKRTSEEDKEWNASGERRAASGGGHVELGFEAEVERKFCEQMNKSEKIEK